jgi:hypothetical protein
MGLAVAVGSKVGGGVSVSVGLGSRVWVAGADVRVGGTFVLGETRVDVALGASPGWAQAESTSPHVSRKRIVVFVFIDASWKKRVIVCTRKGNEKPGHSTSRAGFGSMMILLFTLGKQFPGTDGGVLIEEAEKPLVKKNPQ